MYNKANDDLPEIPPPHLPPIGEVKLTRIAELKPFMKSINCKFIILSQQEPEKSTKDGTIWSWRVADKSGSVIANFWDEIGSCIEVGDVLLMTGGFVTMYKNSMRLASKVGTLLRLDEMRMDFDDSLDVSAGTWLPDHQNNNKLTLQ